MKAPRFSAALLALAMATGIACAQTQVDTFTIAATGDTARFWAQIPVGYDPQHPPAILIWWHQLGGSWREMADYTAFDEEANARGWIAASHFGPNDRHWNTARAQEHCRTMLDWIASRYPFHRDSIYMIGGSMGGAAGQVWHNNNCGPEDYFIAATAGGSQILDCQLRQEQYLADGDTNFSMRAAFGGLPAERDSVAFQYHRTSAIFFADTSQSMHFNSLHLPVWNTWGATLAESTTHGFPAVLWNSLRRAGGADTTLTQGSNIGAHGLGIMPADSICNWLSGFSANRYPDEISINADENDTYYWTTVTLLHDDTTFGRYGVRKDSTRRLLKVALLRNIAALDVNFAFPWPVFDSLNCTVMYGEGEPPDVGLALVNVPQPERLSYHYGAMPSWNYATGVLNLTLHGDAGFTVIFQTGDAPERVPAIPTKLRIVRAYPNPFNSVVMFEIESPAAMVRDLVWFDLLGRVALLKSVTLSPGTQRIFLSADGLASGTYYARLSGGSRPLRVVLIR
ncbi:MAG: hypothetical protein NT025_01095 [bacterium]|nr:hypothetical protein [bacterium]